MQLLSHFLHLWVPVPWILNPCLSGISVRWLYSSSLHPSNGTQADLCCACPSIWKDNVVSTMHFRREALSHIFGDRKWRVCRQRLPPLDSDYSLKEIPAKKAWGKQAFLRKIVTWCSGRSVWSQVLHPLASWTQIRKQDLPSVLREQPEAGGRKTGYPMLYFCFAFW